MNTYVLIGMQIVRIHCNVITNIREYISVIVSLLAVDTPEMLRQQEKHPNIYLSRSETEIVLRNLPISESAIIIKCPNICKQ